MGHRAQTSSANATVPERRLTKRACACFPVLQVKKCADAGADIVRITVQGKKEAEACMRIREQLFKDRRVAGGAGLRGLRGA